MKKDKVVYSLCVDDICNVASQEIGRELTDKEIKAVSAIVGDHIDWYEAIQNAIYDCQIKL
jgi:hypothetical protein